MASSVYRARAMRSGFVSFAASMALAALTGCYASMVRAPAVRRASVELDCPEEELETIRRSDLTAASIEVRGCGQAALYTCPKGVCVRER